MDALSLLRQAVLFVHVLVFAIALATVLCTDLAVLRHGLDAARIEAASRRLLPALVVLWISGLAMVGLDTGFVPAELVSRPKLLAKLVVVSMLSLNGLALHAFVLPALRRGVVTAAAVALGAFSTASWLFATFVGVSRSVEPVMGLGDYLALYAAALLVAVPLGTLALQPRMVPMEPHGAGGRRLGELHRE